MQVNRLKIASNNGVEVNVTSGRVGGLLNRMFGCWHKELSRPFSSHGHTYRSCLNCGARRQFNLGRWEMQGGFYYNLPTSKHFSVLNGMPAASDHAVERLRDNRQRAQQCA